MKLFAFDRGMSVNKEEMIRTGRNLLCVLALSIALLSLEAWSQHPMDVAREKLVAVIEGEATSVTCALDALCVKAMQCPPDAAKVRGGTWGEVWPSGRGWSRTMWRAQSGLSEDNAARRNGKGNINLPTSSMGLLL